jgi:energy-coupling factor transporter ATP-binding protein EcfA2
VRPVALTLIGGVQHVDSSGTRVRGESHLLLVGDPGTGKSQFLKYVAKLSHRSVMTTGIGSTSAGLTVTAVKDGGIILIFSPEPLLGPSLLRAPLTYVAKQVNGCWKRVLWCWQMVVSAA